jgi:hypothetical protein
MRTYQTFPAHTLMLNCCWYSFSCNSQIKFVPGHIFIWTFVLLLLCGTCGQPGQVGYVRAQCWCLATDRRDTVWKQLPLSSPLNANHIHHPSVSAGNTFANPVPWDLFQHDAVRAAGAPCSKPTHKRRGILMAVEKIEMLNCLLLPYISLEKQTLSLCFRLSHKRGVGRYCGGGGGALPQLGPHPPSALIQPEFNNCKYD